MAGQFLPLRPRGSPLPVTLPPDDLKNKARCLGDLHSRTLKPHIPILIYSQIKMDI